MNIWLQNGCRCALCVFLFFRFSKRVSCLFTDALHVHITNRIYTTQHSNGNNIKPMETIVKLATNLFTFSIDMQCVRIPMVFAFKNWPYMICQTNSWININKSDFIPFHLVTVRRLFWILHTPGFNRQTINYVILHLTPEIMIWWPNFNSYRRIDLIFFAHSVGDDTGTMCFIDDKSREIVCG